MRRLLSIHSGKFVPKSSTAPGFHIDKNIDYLSADIMEETLLNIDHLSFEVLMDNKIVKFIDLLNPNISIHLRTAFHSS